MNDAFHALPPSRHMNRRKKTLILCILCLGLLAGVFLAGVLIPDAAVSSNFSQKNTPPCFAYPFGTDWLGRNMLLRTLKGLSLSIMVGAVASAVSAVLATLIGVAAALGSKMLDTCILWFIDLIMGIPHLVLLILISFACGRGFFGLLLGISATHWPTLARLIRAEVLQLRTQPYIAVSRKLGRTGGWILRHHILPHMLPQFLIGLVLLFPHAILHESALSFLGFGLPPEQPAIGIILGESMKYLTGGVWWTALFPGLLLVLVVLLFEKLSDNLKRLLSPASTHE